MRAYTYTTEESILAGEYNYRYYKTTPAYRRYLFKLAVIGGSCANC